MGRGLPQRPPSVPVHPCSSWFVCSSSCVWHLLEQRTGHDRYRDFEAETKTLGWEALPAGLPAQPTSGNCLNQTHVTSEAPGEGKGSEVAWPALLGMGSLSWASGSDPAAGQLRGVSGRTPCPHGGHWPPLSHSPPQRLPFMPLSAQRLEDSREQWGDDRLRKAHGRNWGCCGSSRLRSGPSWRGRRPQRALRAAAAAAAGAAEVAQAAAGAARAPWPGSGRRARPAAACQPSPPPLLPPPPPPPSRRVGGGRAGAWRSLATPAWVLTTSGAEKSGGGGRGPGVAPGAGPAARTLGARAAVAAAAPA